MNSQVFVTGANGMLGISICKELIRQNYRVKAMILPGRNSFDLSELEIEIVYGNILDSIFLHKELSDCEYIIHTAALTNVWPRRSESVMSINVEGTKNVMKAAEETGIKRMIHIGTASSFGYGTMEEPGIESNEYDGWKYGMDYMDSKYLAQKILLERYSKNGFPVVIINPTYMIGPFDSGPSSGKILIELMKGNLPGYSPGGKNFVCSSDVATASVNALKLGHPGECYIVGSENLYYKDFFKKVCVVRNKKIKLRRIPVFMILTAGLLNSLKAKLLSTPPALSYSMARFSCICQFYKSGKAVHDLNISLTPIEEGINSCIEWFESNGYLDKYA
jgi:dihydroflavonol-4-reductase